MTSDDQDEFGVDLSTCVSPDTSYDSRDMEPACSLPVGKLRFGYALPVTPHKEGRI